MVNIAALVNVTMSVPTTNTTDNITTKNNTYPYHKLDRTPVITSVSVISVLAVVSNLTLLFVIFSRKQLRSNVFLWNVAGMCVSNLLFGTITNALGDSRFIYKEWLHGTILCKVFSVFDLTSTHIMSMIQITIVISLFLKVKLSLSPPSDITSRIWTILPYILFSLPWLGEVALIPVVILGEMNDLPDYAKKYGSLMCFHFLEKNTRQAGVVLVNIFFFIILVLSIAVFLYYRFKKASYDRLLADDAMRQDETLRSMLIASLASSGMFCLLFAPFVYMMLHLVFCRSSWCRPNIRLFDAFYVTGCVTYAATPLAWFMHNDIKCVFVEVLDKIKGKLRSTLTLCSGCCRTKLESITVEWNPKQSDIMSQDK